MNGVDMDHLGVRIETAETFAVDWAKVKNDRIFDGDGKRVEQYYGFGEDVLAVADGTVVSMHDGMPDETRSPSPSQTMAATTCFSRSLRMSSPGTRICATAASR